MVQDALHELRADVPALIRCVDDNIPDRGSKHIIGEDSAARDESVSIPSGYDHIGMLQHDSSVLQRPSPGPIRLLE